MDRLTIPDEPIEDLAKQGEKMARTNYEMIHEMTLPELAAWVAVQIRQYYLSDNTVISDEETKQIVHIYVDWLLQQEGGKSNVQEQ